VEGLFVGGVGIILLLIIALPSLAIYFVPTIVAKVRHHKDFVSILVLNIFLGWSLIGWVVALVWALKNQEN